MIVLSCGGTFLRWPILWSSVTASEDMAGETIWSGDEGGSRVGVTIMRIVHYIPTRMHGDVVAGRRNAVLAIFEAGSVHDR